MSTAGATAAADGAPLLEVNHLSTRFATGAGLVRAVRDVSFSLRDGETLGVVGESGSGKTVTMLSIMGLLPGPPRTEMTGEIRFAGERLSGLSNDQLRSIRGNRIAMVFQDPATSLNPVLSVGRQLMEPLRTHLKMTRPQARTRAIELMQLVNIPAPAARLTQYPHQFSGGMRQRIMIAMALACHPRLLIADEPTTALDVTVQAGIVELVKRLRDEMDMAIIWVTHDLSLLAGLVDRVAVMYAGRFVEDSTVDELYRSPRHPYTMGLLDSIPRGGAQRHSRLMSIEGLPPNLLEDIPGCAFEPRCPYAVARSAEERPELEPVAPGHFVACWVRPERTPR